MCIVQCTYSKSSNYCVKYMCKRGIGIQSSSTGSSKSLFSAYLNGSIHNQDDHYFRIPTHNETIISESLKMRAQIDIDWLEECALSVARQIS